MKNKAYLLGYQYIYHCQGTKETANDYVLIHAPDDASFNNIRSRLVNAKNHPYNYEINIESIENLTID